MIAANADARPRSDFWEWAAEYDDGSLFCEYDLDGFDHSILEIDQTRLVRLILAPTVPGLATHAIQRRAGETVNLWRRRSISIDPATGEQTRSPGLTILCVERDDLPPAYTFLFPDGSLLISTDFNAVND